MGTSLQRWLSRHAVLLRHLDTQQADIHERKEAGEAVAAALDTAASLPGGLKLQTLSTSSVPVLNAAAAHSSSLTRLHLRMHAQSLDPGPGILSNTPATALKGLDKQLRSLDLQSRHSPFPVMWGITVSGAGSERMPFPVGSFSEFLQDTLPQLTALTSLVVGELGDSSVLQYAPAQLKTLKWVAVDDAVVNTLRLRGRKLDLGHLTACTSLTLHYKHVQMTTLLALLRPGPGCSAPAVRPNDTLPPCLSQLTLVDCWSATPLLQLSHLTALSIAPHCRMEASELRRLSALTSLRKVALAHHSLGPNAQQAANRGAAGWSHVPALQELDLRGQLVNPDINSYLHQLTALTRLAWSDTLLHDDLDGGPVMLLDTGMDEVTLYQLGPSLPPSLRVLDLSDFILSGAGAVPWRPGVFGALRALVSAARALPHLNSLSISNSLEDWPEAARELFEKIKGRLAMRTLGCMHRCTLGLVSQLTVRAVVQRQ